AAGVGRYHARDHLYQLSSAGEHVRPEIRKRSTAGTAACGQAPRERNTAAGSETSAARAAQTQRGHRRHRLAFITNLTFQVIKTSKSNHPLIAGGACYTLPVLQAAI